MAAPVGPNVDGAASKEGSKSVAQRLSDYFPQLSSIPVPAFVKDIVADPYNGDENRRHWDALRSAHAIVDRRYPEVADIRSNIDARIASAQAANLNWPYWVWPPGARLSLRRSLEKDFNLMTRRDDEHTYEALKWRDVVRRSLIFAGLAAVGETLSATNLSMSERLQRGLPFKFY